MTPPRIIISFLQKGTAIKLSFAEKVSGLVGSSHSNAQYPPSGIALSVYFVPDLSVRKVQIVGGNPIQNSLTFTHVFFAARKCPNSCKRIRIINNTIPIIISNNDMRIKKRIKD